MKKTVLAIAIALAFPALARAGLVTMVARDVPLAGRSLQAVAVPMRFNMLGVHWQGSGAVEYRTLSAAGRWSPWVAADADTGPDPGSGEGSATAGTHDGNLAWVGASTGVQFRPSGSVAHVRAFYLWSKVTKASRRTALVAGLPAIVPRSGWEADEKITRAKPSYAPVLKLAIVHHTAGSNNYTAAQAPAIVRGIEVYHVKANGWNDIGYNFLIDRFGTVYEGRAGGIERNVIGAHALGFNTGSVGVSLIGNFSTATPPPAMQTALVNLLAWRLDVAHIDPLSTVKDASGGNYKFKAGKVVTLRAISGHRDTGPTECPGNGAYALLPSLTKRVSLTGLPKLYAPVATGALGGSIRFAGRLSSALPWTVTVTGPTGLTVAKGQGSTATVDWTWNSAAAGKGPFAWSIAAGSSVLPASGTFGTGKVKAAAAPVTAPVVAPVAAVAPADVSALTASPAVVSPSADGTGGYVAVDFTLGGAAAVTVTATPVAPSVAPPLTLLSANLSAGDNSFSWSLAPLADGLYQVVVTAKSKSGSPSVQSVPVTVDRSLTGLTTTSALISPNGDGVNDSTTIGFSLTQSLPVQLLIEYYGTVVGTIFTGQLGPGPQTIAWDGTTRGVRIPDGAYDAVVVVTDPLGAVSFSIPVTVDTTPPALTLLDAATLRFQLSEPATVTVTVNGQPVVRPEPAGVFTLPWQGGPVTTISAQADDAAGNLSPILTAP
jgi:hypothetical protein